MAKNLGRWRALSVGQAEKPGHLDFVETLLGHNLSLSKNIIPLWFRRLTILNSVASVTLIKLTPFARSVAYGPPTIIVNISYVSSEL